MYKTVIKGYITFICYPVYVNHPHKSCLIAPAKPGKYPKNIENILAAAPASINNK